jgi:hypothetical protein
MCGMMETRHSRTMEGDVRCCGLQECHEVRQAARHAAAHVQLQLGNHLAALRHANAALSSSRDAAGAPENDVRCIAAECLALAGDHGNAVAAFLLRDIKDASVELPESQQSTARVLRCAASAQLSTGSVESLHIAAQHAGAAKQLQPDSHAAALLAVQAELLAGNTAGALTLVRNAPSSQRD